MCDGEDPWIVGDRTPFVADNLQGLPSNPPPIPLTMLPLILAVAAAFPPPLLPPEFPATAPPLPDEIFNPLPQLERD